jgi:hypothetical protein
VINIVYKQDDYENLPPPIERGPVAPLKHNHLGGALEPTPAIYTDYSNSSYDLPN